MAKKHTKQTKKQQPSRASEKKRVQKEKKLEPLKEVIMEKPILVAFDPKAVVAKYLKMAKNGVK